VTTEISGNKRVLAFLSGELGSLPDATSDCCDLGQFTSPLCTFVLPSLSLMKAEAHQGGVIPVSVLS